MSSNKTQNTSARNARVTRRELIISGVTMAAASVAVTGTEAKAAGHRSKPAQSTGNNALKPPFDSMRDYVEGVLTS